MRSAEKTGESTRPAPALATSGGLTTMALGGPAIEEGALRLTHIVGLSQGLSEHLSSRLEPGQG